MQITPITHPLSATVRVPGSKSLTNRALLIASLANGTTRLTNALFSDDSRYFAKALQTLGFDIQLDAANHEMIITGLGGVIPADKAELFIGNAGTAARFLSAFLTLGNGEFILDGDARMRERPVGDLVESLTQLGANIQPIQPSGEAFNLRPSSACPPVKIFANGLPGGKTRIAGDISSQFLSALLMVAPYAQNPIEITHTTELNSKPYVDMTIAVMQDFSVEVKRNAYQFFSIPITNYQLPISNSQPSSTYAIESDASAASYFFAASAICGGTVCVENISRKSKQGDIAFLDVLQKMGCVITDGADSISVARRSGNLCGIDIDMRDIPDTAQTLAAVAPFASSPTRIRGIASARVKETDRVHATCTELARLGVRVEEHEDGMTIYPVEKMRPAIIQTYNDHRMAMSFSLIGLRFNGVTIENPSCVSKTFPDYFEVLETLR
ncbi:MAG: 3-phosphoshikimate 1-carboxyvinyltransferase [Anaerolineales bacterium]|nr:3-phosphoshikimate 1-carboxyvinyltransferase [Anaerolineales bacterium]